MVELLGELTSFLVEIRRLRTADGGEVTVSEPGPSGPIEENLTIHGELEGSPDLVTLIGAFTVRRSPVEHTLQCAYAVLGSHVTSAHTFSAARIRIKHLDEWLGRPEDISALTFHGHHERRIDGEEPGLRPQAATLAELPAGIQLRLGARAEIMDWASHCGSAARVAEFEMQALPAYTVAEVWGLVDPLSTLLTLAVNRSCPPTMLEVYDAQAGWIRVVDPRLDTEEATPLERHSLLMPWPLLNLSHFAAWIARYESLRPIPTMAAAAVEWVTRPLESELLELATAAEGLHQRLPHWSKKNGVVTPSTVKAVKKAIHEALESIGNKEAYPYYSDSLGRVEYVSYGRRLEDLLGRASDVAPDVAGSNVDEWIRLVKKARNTFAHLPSGDSLAARPGLHWQANVALALSLRWLLTTLLFLEAEIDAETLKNRLNDDQQYILFQIQAHSWLPSVFGNHH